MDSTRLFFGPRDNSIRTRENLRNMVKPPTARSFFHHRAALPWWEGDMLGGSWYFVTNSNCTYSPLVSPLSALIWL